MMITMVWIMMFHANWTGMTFQSGRAFTAQIDCERAVERDKETNPVKGLTAWCEKKPISEVFALPIP
jgi:hypothetical protein